MTVDRKPSKPWRVYGVRGISTDYRSERAAYEQVRTLLGIGVKVTVYKWMEGAWRLFERHDPSELSPKADEGIAP